MKHAMRLLCSIFAFLILAGCGTERPTALEKKPTSGWILDARQFDWLPELAPVIVDQNHQRIYTPAIVRRRAALRIGMVEYTATLQAARDTVRAGKNPYVSSVLRVDRNNRLVISAEDSRRIRADSDLLKALRRARVVIIVRK